MKLLVEGGATKTIGIMDDGRRYTVGPTNLHVVGKDGVYKNIKKLLAHFKQKPTEYHFYLSGLKSRMDKIKMKDITKKLGLKGRIVLGHDLLGGLLQKSSDGTGIIVVSGTGSAVYGRNNKREEAQVGGMGEKLGDEGGSYSIAINGMRAAIRSYDGRGPKTTLENKFGKIEKLTDWLAGKSKAEIAKLALIVFKEAEKGDGPANKIIDEAIENLIEGVKVVRKKIGPQKIILSGGNFEHQVSFRQKFIQKLNIAKGAALNKLATLRMVSKMIEGDRSVVNSIEKQKNNIIKAIEKVTEAFLNRGRLFYIGAGTSGRIANMDAAECPPTFNVPHKMVQAITTWNEDDKAKLKGIAEKDIVIGISASGTTPFVASALEEAKRIGAYTILVTAANAPGMPGDAGFSQSSTELRAPSAHAGVASLTVLVPTYVGASVDPKDRTLTSGAKGRADIVIKLSTGPEIVEGSTRLKAGTAAKMVLNMISTISMIKLGRTFGNLMIDVKPKNKKLIKRAVWIISNICNIGEKKAFQFLKTARFNTRNAVRLGLDKRIGELLMFGFDKDKIPMDCGSIIIFDRNAEYLKRIKDKNLFLAVDQEGGRVNRIKKGVTILPAPKYIKTVKEAYKWGAILAKELKKLGIKLDLAPVMDVNTEPANPIIGDRSFGDNQNRVRNLGCAMIRGMQDNGLLACAKHFPGHGATKRDSHKCLPIVNISHKEWETIHFKPFKEAIKTGVSCIMMGHILCPALDKEMPASLSYKIVTGILREQLGFKAVIITDDLGMGAITRHFPPEEAAVLAIMAGCDIILVCKGIAVQKKVRKAIVDAILDGRIPEERIASAVERILKWKKGY